MRKTSTSAPCIRCAIYTRKSTDEGLEQEFNSLDAQREACEAYAVSQRHEGWVVIPTMYDDGGFTGANMERPALKRLMNDIEAGLVDLVLVYKVDRLSRSLLDFTKLIEVFDQRGVSFVSITQSFNTSTAMGKLVLNILLSFAEFERAIIAERVRDKIAGAKAKGKFTGGTPILGYDINADNHKLIVNPDEARIVRNIFKQFAEVGSGQTVAKELNAKGVTTKSWTTREGKFRPGKPWDGPAIYRIIANPTYIGKTKHKDKIYPGEHEAIVTQALWDRAHTLIQHDGRVGNRISENVPSLLKGIIRCGHCDHSMYPTYTKRKGKTYRYYLCVKASKAGYDSCPVKTVAAGEIENAVIGQLRAIFRSPEMIAQACIAARQLEAEEIERLQTEKAEMERRISEQEEYGRTLTDHDSAHHLDEEIQQTNLQLQTVARELSHLQSSTVTQRDVMDSLTKLDPIWEELFPLEQRRIVHLLVERVSVTIDGIDVRIRAGGLHSLIQELKDTTQEDERPCRT